MDSRQFGLTGLQVSAVGLGTGGLGRAEITDRDAERLLHGALDLGVTLIDTARSYGLAEERIGRSLSGRRSHFVLSTKVGYGIPGIQDLTYDAVVAGVREALRTMRTDHLDIVHLHSFPADIIRQNGLFDALSAMQDKGLVRVIAYSGDNDDLGWTIDSGRVGSVECSVNVLDQRVLDWMLPRAKERGLGVIAKRPLANAPWTRTRRPEGHDVSTYWDRWFALHLDLPVDPVPLFLRFAAYTWGVDAVITGVSSLEHLEQNVRAVDEGILPGGMVEMLRHAFRTHDQNWYGVT
ncbi:MAG: hypothetical protein A2X67_10410 [Ignavibacteria bacterium GWA2_55_11]|nr:MAG: hypothetical protein A2X67_10410 [Ignavibacteria bacterium GWA2_55_11]OGU47876.1 MAG: hypothetical protein A2X68_07140 [Ignavibacteria bacterium GWC2_56_12]OGU68035.1 MAG: hypothetical protein A3C56_01560 [Ignavibacteria bacterium RIFCSPHIGHO2_02_FULL_56_12]OGU72870.1 MAG: hypothetical protein A3H45_00170 [Ignavibacteria bacterium RIFCSPLOWO2_02_FULL_55_14]OGU76104.1 MAG: hypothetical protein A3G43_08490 [Ignavibacteria bacterium RIFCSPLOWO2_12_FULL_56_21]HAV24469.1 aldo/keto reductase